MEETTLQRLMRDNEYLYKKLRLEERKFKMAVEALEKICVSAYEGPAQLAKETVKKINRLKFENGL